MSLEGWREWKIQKYSTLEGPRSSQEFSVRALHIKAARERTEPLEVRFEKRYQSSFKKLKSNHSFSEPSSADLVCRLAVEKVLRAVTSTLLDAPER